MGVLRENLFKGLKKKGNLDRLRYVSVHPCIAGALLVFLEGVGRHGQDGRVALSGPLELSNGLRCLVSVHNRHLDIHQHQVVASRIYRLHLVNGFGSVEGRVYREPGALEYLKGDLAVKLVVFREQHPLAVEVGNLRFGRFAALLG